MWNTPSHERLLAKSIPHTDPANAGPGVADKVKHESNDETQAVNKKDGECSISGDNRQHFRK